MPQVRSAFSSYIVCNTATYIRVHCTVAALAGLQHQPESQLWGRRPGSPLAGSKPLHQAILVSQVLLNLLTHVEDGTVTAGTQHTEIIRLVKQMVSGNMSLVLRFNYLLETVKCCMSVKATAMVSSFHTQTCLKVHQ